MREIFEDVIMFQLRPEEWAEINWVQGTERWREKEGAPGRLKSNCTGPMPGALLVCSFTVQRPVQLDWVRQGQGRVRGGGGQGGQGTQVL